MAFTDQGKCATGMMKKLEKVLAKKRVAYASNMTTMMTNLFESSAIPANALYQARKAARIAKKPPALMMGGFGMPMASR